MNIYIVLAWMFEFFILLEDFITEIIFIRDSILVSYIIKNSFK